MVASLGIFFKLHVREVVLRLSNHLNVWRNLFLGTRKIYDRHVSDKYRVGDGEATGSRIVAVGILAYTSLKNKRGGIGSSGADGSTKNVSWHATQVPCVKLRL